MSYENLIYEKKDGIAWITFNRPKVLNALNRKTVEELHQALLDARDDVNVRVLILTGAGEKAFVAGADISERKRVFAVRAECLPFVRNDGQAFDLRDQWVRTRRRVRTGAFLHHSNRQQNRETWPARSEARHSAGLWRLAAACAALR